MKYDESDVIAFPYDCMNSHDYKDLVIIKFLHKYYPNTYAQTKEEKTIEMTLDSGNLMVLITGLMNIYDSHQDKHNSKINNIRFKEFFTKHGIDLGDKIK